MRVFTLAALLLTAPTAAATTVVVLPSTSDDAADLEAGLRRGLTEIGGYEVQAADLTRTHVESAIEMGVACAADDDECLLKLGVLAEANLLILSTRTDDSLSLRVIDVRARKATGSLTHPIAATASETARQAVILLLRPTMAQGSLEIIAPAGASVQLDGGEAQTAPLSQPIAGLAPGEHVVRATLEGHDPLEQRVVVPFAGAQRVELTLKKTAVVEEPVPTLEPTMPEVDPQGQPKPSTTVDDEAGLGPLTLAGAAITGVGAAATAGLAAGALYFEYDLLILEADYDQDDQKQFAFSQGAAQGLWVATIVAGAVMAIGIGVLGAGLLAE